MEVIRMEQSKINWQKDISLIINYLVTTKPQKISISDYRILKRCVDRLLSGLGALEESYHLRIEFHPMVYYQFNRKKLSEKMHIHLSRFQRHLVGKQIQLLKLDIGNLYDDLYKVIDYYNIHQLVAGNKIGGSQ